jgi:hypothetical protein
VALADRRAVSTDAQHVPSIVIEGDSGWVSSGEGESKIRVGKTGEGDLAIEGPAVDPTQIPSTMVPGFAACLRALGVI